MVVSPTLCNVQVLQPRLMIEPSKNPQPTPVDPLDRRWSVLVVYGTRPEAIKLAPVVRALRQRPEALRVAVCATSQHRQMIDQMHRTFDLAPDFDLDLMRSGQSLNDLAARAFHSIDQVLAAVEPDWVLVQGDTTSAAVAAMAAFHRGIRVGHVEAGLRTGDLRQPFPEEANRRIVDLLAEALFAPTQRSCDNLRREGVPGDRIHLTGNTVVDAVHQLRQEVAPEARDEVLLTVHRRESFGEPLRQIFAALRDLAVRFPRVLWTYPVHPNPEVQGPAHELLAELPNVDLRAPMDYPELVACLSRCRLVLTDSGGLQEEAPAFGKPVLVLREKTERWEGVEAGVARLVGTDRRRIFAAAEELLTDRDAYAAMSRVANPYGDGRASERIADVLCGRPYSPFAVAEDRSVVAAPREAARR